MKYNIEIIWELVLYKIFNKFKIEFWGIKIKFCVIIKEGWDYVGGCLDVICSEDVSLWK